MTWDELDLDAALWTIVKRRAIGTPDRRAKGTPFYG